MNPRELYLGYVRTAHPKLYFAALHRVFNPKAGLSGLGDDLTDSIAPDVTQLAVVPDASVNDSIDSAATAAQQDNTSAFNAFANGISTIASSVVQTQAAENLLQINTQRARMGLPPITQNGYPVTASMLSPTSSSLAQMEAALSGSNSWLLPALLIGGVGLVALTATRRS